MINNSEERVILFDLGNILVRLNPVTAIWDLAKIKNPPEDLNLLWAKSAAVTAYETGRIKSLPEFYEAMGQENPLKVDYAEFSDIIANAIADPFPGSHQLLASLKEYYPLYLLSNTNELHWSICQNQHQLGAYFADLFLSYEIGVMKPHPAIYETAIKAINTDPQNIWFYDDNKDNVKKAKEAGINALLSFGGETLNNDLRNSGFLV